MSETIEPGETEKIVPSHDTDQELHLTVRGADVKLGRTKDEAEMDGRPGSAGDRGPITVEAGEDLWAFNPDNSPDTKPATLYLDRDGFFWTREPRDVVGSVRTSSDNEASPANDDFRWVYQRDADPSAGIVEAFRAPDAADTVVVSVDDANDTVEVAVVFLDRDEQEITRRGPGNSSAYAGGPDSDVFAETVIASDRIAVEITGAATSADFTIYAR